jgi:hypothetical protein
MRVEGGGESRKAAGADRQGSGQAVADWRGERTEGDTLLDEIFSKHVR